MMWSLSTFHDYERKGGRPCVDNLGPFVMCNPDLEAIHAYRRSDQPSRTRNFGGVA